MDYPDEEVKSGSFSIVPNYSALFEQFMKEFEGYCNSLSRSNSEDELSLVRRILVPLNIACSAITNTDQVAEFQNRLTDAIEPICRQHDKIQYEDYEYGTD